jgi:hypothetical protein
VADYDKDGDLDIFVVAFDGFSKDDKSTWNRLLKNEKGTFIDFTQSAGFSVQHQKAGTGINGIKLGASWGDYDNDGYPDLFLTNFGTDELWHNNQDGTFTNVTSRSGVRGCRDCYSVNALWFDYDSDGDLDLYVSDWLKANRLYENKGNGYFNEVTEKAGVGDTGNTWTTLAIDVNNDTHQDIYVINDFGHNYLYENQGDGTFIEKTQHYGLEDRGEGMGADICDYNSDGIFDIYLTNIYALQPNPFFEGSASGRFVNKAKLLGIDSAGWAWGTRFFDADHDMDQDLYVVTGNELSGSVDYNMFFKYDQLEYKDVSTQAGVKNGLDARGLEVFDYDEDGDLDMIVTNWNGNMLLYNNKSTQDTRSGKNWIKVELEGTESNRDAFGAIVRIQTGDKYQYRLHHGANLMGQSIMPVHFGLAGHQTVDEIKVTWPSGNTDIITQVKANRKVKIKEGAKLVTAIGNSSGEHQDNGQSLQLLPVPVTTGTLNITLGNRNYHTGNAILTIYNTQGQQMQKAIELNPGHRSPIAIDVTSLSAGQYIIQYKTQQHLITQKFIVE